MFDQHDARNNGMAPRTRRGLPSRPKPAFTAATSPAGTPKRAQKTRAPLADGFDDDDVIMASPSKHRERQKTATPRQAGKRKRQAIDQSPIPMPALQLSAPRTRPKEPEPPAQPRIDVALLQHFRKEDSRFTLLHRLLSHRSSNGTDRILEALAQHAFPSQPSKKLSSIIYDTLAVATMSDVHELALQICHIFLDLWQRCLDEKHYASTNLIFDALHFVLACEPGKTAVKLIERAVPLIIASIDLFAYPLAKAAKQGGKSIETLYSAAQRDIRNQIDALDCLELLYILATSCVSSTDADAVSRLWQNIPSETAVMLLNKEHPQPQITLMLRILSTSALPTSIGPIVSSDTQNDTQAAREDALINRLTNMFTETPTPIPDPSLQQQQPPPPTPTSDLHVWDLRLLVLSVLTQFSIPVTGCTRLATNSLCIGRLIKYLDTCITSLYAAMRISFRSRG
ncbi:hypothetical protein P153DRAFT_51052 [Dothidotthia symphoricarpi CBS 119687]|uniref:Uncharacterized protein n=1 Tax=Dothidotthia symphoricarpi CBS 119687 TaxID=1392245 RepID=A0A6A6A6B2_9PLEO|nr:uncharacterized protein P153DRAFT_51052 [Dothidotthia symphoricarpi CBS 119687]KAF2127512.1 hypothetical protein P153DRAFT_51052 [Dothidotthia symphoricarpi CBS 119687]